MKGRPPTLEQLRQAIDSGQTGDKVRHLDPAASPLGTDDEAAGSTPTAERIALACCHEILGSAPGFARKRTPSRALSLLFVALLILGLTIILLIAFHR